ncbi:hypothetical protein DL96DRAFT_1561622 [Flagelloscypha sp. PMI_526]|nr:hypothetical protein DL96DRAFT_1561622 [Flagelloscypha sp. PMI_526]
MEFIFDLCNTEHIHVLSNLEKNLLDIPHDLRKQWVKNERALPLAKLFMLGAVEGLRRLDLALHRVAVRGVGLLVTNELFTRMAKAWNDLEDLSLDRHYRHNFWTKCEKLRRFSVGYDPNIMSGSQNDIMTGFSTRYPDIVINLDPVTPASPESDASDDE